MAVVSNGGNFEGNTVQSSPVRAGFDQPQAGLFCIREHKFSGVVGPQVDDALGVVHDIPGALYLSNFIGACGEVGQIDLTAAVSHKFLRAKAAVHGPDTEFSIGNGLGRVGAVHLYQFHAGLGVVEEKQLFCPTAGGQLNLLGGGVLDVTAVPSIHLDCPIGARLNAGQQNLTALVGFVMPQRNTVPEDFKGDIRHGPVALPVIFHDLQSDLRQVLEY